MKIEGTDIIGGRQIEHWNDRVDAVITPRPVELTTKVKE